MLPKLDDDKEDFKSKSDANNGQVSDETGRRGIGVKASAKHDIPEPPLIAYKRQRTNSFHEFLIQNCPDPEMGADDVRRSETSSEICIKKPFGLALNMI